jgi:thiamine biosynthesis protein ThiS
LFVKITVNGQAMELDAETTVEGLLDRLGVPRQYTAVAVNREVTPKSEYAAVKLGEGDRVEIVRPFGGG